MSENQGRPPGSPLSRVRWSFVLGFFVLLVGSISWVLELVVVITKVLDPQAYFVYQFAYTGLWLLLWAGILVWGWRRLLAPARRPVMDEHGHAHFDSEAPEEHEPGRHPGFTEGKEPPGRW